MPRHTHPGRKRARRNIARLNARQAEAPAGPRPRVRHRPPRCHECGSRDGVEEYAATPLVESSRRPDKPRTLLLCPACLRDRGASWRWRWKITGRELPEDRAA